MHHNWHVACVIHFLRYKNDRKLDACISKIRSSRKTCIYSRWKYCFCLFIWITLIFRCSKMIADKLIRPLHRFPQTLLFPNSLWMKIHTQKLHCHNDIDKLKENKSIILCKSYVNSTWTNVFLKCKSHKQTLQF